MFSKLGRTRPSQRKSAAIAPVLLVLLGAMAIVAGSVPSAPTVHAAPVIPESAAQSPSAEPYISVAPGSWPMMAGDSVVLTAAVIGVPYGCGLSSFRFAWTLPGASAFEGMLNASEGTSVRFSAASSSSGAATIAVDGAGAIACGSEVNAWSSVGSATVAITPQERVSSLAAYPNPSTPGGRVVLEWNVAGGQPPYIAEVAYGDGTSSSFTIGSAGSPYVDHRYAAGNFYPQVHVTDSSGRTLPTALETPLLVTSGLAASIVLRTSSVDPNVPFTVYANVSGGSPPYIEFWQDSLGGQSWSENWSMSAPEEGNLSVSLQVGDMGGNVARVTRTIRVMPSPSFDISGGRSTTDVGTTFPLSVRVVGGVAPYLLNWSVPGTASPQSSALPSTGNFTEPVVASTPGEVWVTAQLTDAAGALRSLSTPVAEAFSPPQLTILSAPGELEAGLPATVTASLMGGAPPVNWSMTTSSPVTNVSGNVGTLSGPGALQWRGTFATANDVVWLLQVTDGALSTVVVNGSVRVLSAPVVHLSAPSSGAVAGHALPLTGTIEGGVGPYTYVFALSDQETEVGNATRTGGVYWNATPLASGSLDVQFRITDGLGGGSEASLSLAVSPIAPPAGPTATTPSSGSAGISGSPSIGPWVLGLAGLAFGAMVFVLPRWRQRTGRGKRGGSDSRALGSVRRLLRGTDGLERETLYFLAEDEGLAQSAVAAAVERWVRAGRIRIEVGMEGQDLIEWTDPTPSGTEDDGPEREGVRR